MFITDFLKKRKEKKEQEKKERQSWEPKGLLRILKILWNAAVYAVKIAAGAAATVFVVLAVCVLVFVGLLGDYLQEEIIPEAQGFALENYDLDQTSFVYAVNGDGDIQLLQQIHTSNDRQWATYDQIPEAMINAAVAIEDKRFYEHQGVDWVTTIKACAGMFMGTSDAGGSTITQQLIKNLTEEDSVTVQRKVLEIFRAQLFEKRYDKDTIMEWYLNTIYLGQGCSGVKSAASTYFGKELQMLTTAECAALISITNNPSYYAPYNIDEEVGLDGKANNRKRQENVLWAMKDQGLITEKEYDSAMAQEMVFKSGIADEDRLVICENESCGYYDVRHNYTADEEGMYSCPKCGQRVEIQVNASQNVYSWFVDTVLEDVAEDLAKEQGATWNDDTKRTYMQLIQRSGYHIYTTMDMDVQAQLDAVYTNLDEIPDTRSGQQLWSAMCIIDNKTGDIVAICGNVGEKTEHDGWNNAVDAKLQTGSSIKPLASYAPAFELGVVSPATVVLDLPMEYTNGAFPRNDNFKYNYSKTVLSGVVSSTNAIAVRVLDMIGTQYSYDFAKYKFRLSSLTDNYLSPYDGIVKSDIGLSPLGMGALTIGCSVRDMTAAFATFANEGVYREDRTYTKVYDSEGNIILDNLQESERILSEKTVNYMNYCLNQAVNGGTGTEARISGQYVAGKTGTTDSYKDRWFCGFTGHYTGAVWCGYKTPERIYITTWGVNNPSAHLWKKVMEPIHRGLPAVSVYDNDMSFAAMCLDGLGNAGSACKKDIRTVQDGLSRIDSAPLYWEDIETKSCQKHVLVDYCMDGNGVANEYCQKFAAVEQAKIEEVALVKTTQKELDELIRAKSYGLGEEYINDKFIYLTTDGGADANFHGIKGDQNKDVKAPYIVCSEHTKASWEAYEKTQTPGKDDKPGITILPGITIPIG